MSGVVTVTLTREEAYRVRQALINESTRTTSREKAEAFRAIQKLIQEEMRRGDQSA